jgi:hypothetical protein
MKQTSAAPQTSHVSSTRRKLAAPSASARELPLAASSSLLKQLFDGSPHGHPPAHPKTAGAHWTVGLIITRSEMSTGLPTARLSRTWYTVPLFSPASTSTVARARRAMTQFRFGKSPRRVTVPAANGPSQERQSPWLTRPHGLI